MGNNIFLPYTGHIAGGVHVGTDVVIAGRTTPSFNRFSINLCSGPNYDAGDVAFHFNPRFNDGKVVRNHRQGGQWGSEETHGGMPFRRGHTFELHIKVTHHGFKVTVNHQHFCDFPHRLPKENVHYIYIEGDATISFIEFRGSLFPHSHSHSFPTPSFQPVPSYQPPPPAYPAGQAFPPSFPSVPAYPGQEGPLYNPPVPLTKSIPGGLYPGKIIYITGVPYPNPSRFTVNLACGPFESSDFALHFDVRFNYGSDVNQVIRTHKQGSSYGSEERFLNYFPFYPNSSFELMILTEPGSFKIAVNNQHFTEFFHRIQPVQRVDHLMVLGDVSLTQVRFQ